MINAENPFEANSLPLNRVAVNIIIVSHYTVFTFIIEPFKQFKMKRVMINNICPKNINATTMNN